MNPAFGKTKPMRLTIKQLEVFLAVARCENLSQAAGCLYMSKGAVSQTIGEIESRLGLSLFDRHHARLFINSEGRRLVPLADEMLRRMNDIDLLFDDRNGDRTLSLGCSKTIGSYLLPNLLSSFKQRWHWLPEVVIENSSVLVGKMLNFEHDLALIEGEVRAKDIVAVPWRQDEMVVIARRNHPLAQGEPVSLSRLSEYPWILREKGSGSREHFDDHLAPLLTRAEVILSLDAFDPILFCVHRGLGITFASRLLIEHPFFAAHFSIVPIKQRFYRTLSLCHHQSKYLSASAKQWIDFLQEQAACKQKPPGSAQVELG